tara:strand:- start:5707 stop:6177 length:471 start_codon:yes stop_codon:yes gene_type:complete
MKKGLGEIIMEASKASSKADKVKILREHDYTNNSLRGILQLAYDNNIKWALPEGRPPFKKLDKTMDTQGSLYKELRRMYLFIEGGHPTLQDVRREVLFINMLEELDPDDAELLIMCKERSIKGLPKDVVQEAFPNFLSDEINTQKNKKKPKAEKTA